MFSEIRGRPSRGENMISSIHEFQGTAADSDLTLPGGGTQREVWHRFYRAQWGARRQFLEKHMDDGETSVMRLVGLLDKFERKTHFD